jgi:SPFH domain / Band 7 family
MLNLAYFKGQPTEYILKYSAGKLRREGPGLAFYYFKHNTQVVAVPTSSTDAGFVFNEVTNNFQSVTIQGQLTYRITSPRQASELLNFTIDPRTRKYASNDPERLSQRITNVVQMETRGELQKLTLEEAISRYESVAATVQSRIKSARLLDSLGVELLSVYFVAAKPTPEVAKALEAGYRETLLRKADEAIYARRASAVEEERKIKENELNTDIALEQQRQQLIELTGGNELREAENRGKALEREAEFKARAREHELAVYRTFEPRALLALALNELGQNAEKVGNLTITSEMLASLLNGSGKTNEG